MNMDMGWFVILGRFIMYYSDHWEIYVVLQNYPWWICYVNYYVPQKKKKNIMFILSEGHYCLVNLNLYIKLRTGLSVKWHVVVSGATVGAGGAVVAVTLSLSLSLFLIAFCRLLTLLYRFCWFLAQPCTWPHLILLNFDINNN